MTPQTTLMHRAPSAHCLAHCHCSRRGRGGPRYMTEGGFSPTVCRGALLRALLILLLVGQEEKGGSIRRCDQEAAKPERLLRAECEQHRLLDPVRVVRVRRADHKLDRHILNLVLKAIL